VCITLLGSKEKNNIWWKLLTFKGYIEAFLIKRKEFGCTMDGTSKPSCQCSHGNITNMQNIYRSFFFYIKRNNLSELVNIKSRHHSPVINDSTLTWSIRYYMYIYYWTLISKLCIDY
jgi:hypothetical protein